LQALGAGSTQVVTKQEAKSVRGQGFPCPLPLPCPICPTITQVNQFTLTGEGPIEVTKVVGVVGAAAATGGGGLIQAQFGGVSGQVFAGTDTSGAAALSWWTQGAGVVEHASLVGTGTITFSQVFTITP
jgi:hypothetical protein